MKFGYARVSKNEQSLDVQIQKLTAAGCDEIFQEKISGAKDNRPQLRALIGVSHDTCANGSLRF